MTQKNVIIADDFRTVRSIVKKTLEKKDFRVLEAVDGNDALKYFDGRKIDLVITDYDMPKMNGAELIKKVKTMFQYRNTPFIMLTTKKKEKKQEEIRGLDLKDWIEKPFTIDKFLTTINKVTG